MYKYYNLEPRQDKSKTKTSPDWIKNLEGFEVESRSSRNERKKKSRLRQIQIFTSAGFICALC